MHLTNIKINFFVASYLEALSNFFGSIVKYFLSSHMFKKATLSLSIRSFKSFDDQLRCMPNFKSLGEFLLLDFKANMRILAKKVKILKISQQNYESDMRIILYL